MLGVVFTSSLVLCDAGIRVVTYGITEQGRYARE